ncbi:MAG: hypothetical protein IJX39_10275 [Clostridia bacterium]|nr:hypothetical protein [Clostridia bacterium]
MREKCYLILQTLGDKAVRAAEDATAMLVAGKSRLDTELRRLRDEAGTEHLALAETAFGADLSVGERSAMIRLGVELSQVVECALETAVLLRGRTVRVWALFDRVRVSAALTGQLLDVMRELGRCNRRRLQSAMRAFSETSGRLAALEMRSLEEAVAENESNGFWPLASALDRWHRSLCAAYASALGLLGG